MVVHLMAKPVTSPTRLRLKKGVNRAPHRSSHLSVNTPMNISYSPSLGDASGGNVADSPIFEDMEENHGLRNPSTAFSICL